ncbi:MAG: mechanosensitive ion channel family protein [Pseudomonadota bacterium]
MDHFKNWLDQFIVELGASDIIAFMMPFIVLAVFFLIFRIVANNLQRFVIKSVSKIGVSIDDQLSHKLIHPLRFLVLVIGLFIALEISKLPEKASLFLSLIVQTLLQFFIFQIIYHLIPAITQLLEHWANNTFRTSFLIWTSKVARVVVIFICGVSILQLWGIQVAPIIGGLGLLGAAIALGSQDLFKNLIAGFLIVSENRFALKDTIHVAGLVEGTVEKIGMRSCLLRQFDDCPVYVPNTQLSDAAVINYTRRRNRRINWYVGLEYGSNVEQLKTIRQQIEDYIMGNDKFIKDKTMPVFVKVDRFSDSSIDLLVYCFSKGNQWEDWLNVKQDLAIEIKKIVEKNNAAFAFPSRSIYIERTDEQILNPTLPYTQEPEKQEA